MKYTKPQVTAKAVASKAIQAGAMKSGNNPDSTRLTAATYEADE